MSAICRRPATPSSCPPARSPRPPSWSCSTRWSTPGPWKHANVHVLPAANWAVAIRNGAPITVNGEPVALQKGDLYQFDGLHLTSKGLSYLTVLLVEQVATTEPLVKQHQRLRDPEAVLREATQGQ